MTLRMDAHTRAQLADLKRAERALKKPLLEAQRAERKAARKAAPKRERRVEHKPDAVKANRGRERDPGFLAFLRRLPCVACLVEGGHCGPTEAAHLRFSDARWSRTNSGMGVKPPDRWATPLGHGHHQHDQHRGREKAFWDRLGIEPGALATDLYETYRAGGDGLAVLRAHVQRRAA